MAKKLFIFLIIIGIYKWWSWPEVITLPKANIEIEYLERCHNPQGLSSPLPIVIALHGNGDYPSNFYNHIFEGMDIGVCFILPAAPNNHGRGYAWPYQKESLALHSAALAEFSTLIQQKYQAQSKPVLFGFSGGGVMAYHSALFHGNSYSFIMPIAGFLTKEQIKDLNNMTGATVYAFHGKQDDVVSYSSGEKAAELLRTHGVDVTFVGSNGNHHALATTDKKKILNQLALLIKTLP